MYNYDGRDLATYLSNMRKCRQFYLINVQPQWVPGTQDIEGFCHDEVVRQFHDPRIERDGGQRIRYMLAGWNYAMRAAEDHDLPTVEDILALGQYVEPEYNSTIGFRPMNVYIGNSMGAPPRLLKELVPLLVQQVNVEPVLGNPGYHPNDYRALWSAYRDGEIVDRFGEMVQSIKTVDDWYLAYEAIHPFADGNGRTGKILHNWLLGSLNEPVLVGDYFGGGNP